MGEKLEQCGSANTNKMIRKDVEVLHELFVIHVDLCGCDDYVASDEGAGFQGLGARD